MLTYGIPEFRLPRKIIAEELEGIILPGININYGKELGRNLFIDDLSKDYDAVFTAPGLWAGKKIPINGIDDEKVRDALSMIVKFNETGKADFKDNVLIIGGGSVAADAAQTAVQAGAKNVKLVCLECEEEMPALKDEIDDLIKAGVEVCNSWSPRQVADGKLEVIGCTSVFDDDGRFSPEFDESIRKTFDFDTIVTAVGQTMESGLEKHLTDTFGNSRPAADKNTCLIKGNIFAGGDLIRGAGTVVEAVADGRLAAMNIDSALRK